MNIIPRQTPPRAAWALEQGGVHPLLAQLFAARGVASHRISIDGRGSHEPIADNGTAAGRAKNRRVEIFVAESAR